MYVVRAACVARHAGKDQARVRFQYARFAAFTTVLSGQPHSTPERALGASLIAALLVHLCDAREQGHTAGQQQTHTTSLRWALRLGIRTHAARPAQCRSMTKTHSCLWLSGLFSTIAQAFVRTALALASEPTLWYACTSVETSSHQRNTLVTDVGCTHTCCKPPPPATAAANRSAVQPSYLAQRLQGVGMQRVIGPTAPCKHVRASRQQLQAVPLSLWRRGAG